MDLELKIYKLKDDLSELRRNMERKKKRDWLDDLKQKQAQNTH